MWFARLLSIVSLQWVIVVVDQQVWVSPRVRRWNWRRRGLLLGSSSRRHSPGTGVASEFNRNVRIQLVWGLGMEFELSLFRTPYIFGIPLWDSWMIVLFLRIIPIDGSRVYRSVWPKLRTASEVLGLRAIQQFPFMLRNTEESVGIFQEGFDYLNIINK